MSDEPLFTESIIGVRAWAIRRGTVLRGAGAGRALPWMDRGRQTLAACLSEPHPAPHPRCGCGLYAFHPFRALFGEQGEGWSSGVALGLVEASGRIEVHSSGFRAERARPTALFLPPEFAVIPRTRRRLERIAWRYRLETVELPLPAHAREWCRHHGLGLDRAVVRGLLKDIPRRRRSRPRDC